MIWRARDGKEEHGTLEVFQTADIHIVDDEVVLSDADSGRCHEGRQFGRRGLFDPQVSGPEFPRGDRFERDNGQVVRGRGVGAQSRSIEAQRLVQGQFLPDRQAESGREHVQVPLLVEAVVDRGDRRPRVHFPDTGRIQEAGLLDLHLCAKWHTGGEGVQAIQRERARDEGRRLGHGADILFPEPGQSAVLVATLAGAHLAKERQARGAQSARPPRPQDRQYPGDVHEQRCLEKRILRSDRVAGSDGGVVLGILRLLVVVVTKQTRDKRNGIFVYVVESLLAALTFLRCCCVILADLVISALFLDEIKSLLVPTE